jgi:hypothetical protein
MPGYPAMVPQRWKVSDWKNARLEVYQPTCKGRTIYRGGSEPMTRDMQLGNVRDTYCEDAYGSLEPHDVDASKVILLRERRSGEETTRSRKRPN